MGNQLTTIWLTEEQIFHEDYWTNSADEDKERYTMICADGRITVGKC